MINITYHVCIHSLHGKLELTISPSDEDDIGLLIGRSDSPSQQTPVDPSAAAAAGWKIEETFIGTDNEEIRREAEAAIGAMGGDIIDIETYPQFR